MLRIKEGGQRRTSSRLRTPIFSFCKNKKMLVSSQYDGEVGKVDSYYGCLIFDSKVDIQCELLKGHSTERFMSVGTYVRHTFF